MKTLTWSLALLAMAVAGTGCGDSRPAPTTPKPAGAPGGAQTATAAALGAADAGASEGDVPYTYTYNPMLKRDPFRSPVAEVSNRSTGNSLCSDPLCQWDLDQLSLVAVVTGDANPIAMVQDPQTRGYVVRRGTKIGKQGGQVTQILRDSLTVTEYFQSPDGKRNPNAVMMHMKSDTSVTPELEFMTGKTVGERLP